MYAAADNVYQFTTDWLFKFISFELLIIYIILWVVVFLALCFVWLQVASKTDCKSMS